MKKEGGFLPTFFMILIIVLMLFGLDKFPKLKETIYGALNSSLGVLLNWNLLIGMTIIVFLITLFSTLVQKYTTDQNELRELKKEQKLLQEEMKKYQDNPAKVSELSKKQFEIIPKTFKLTSRALLFTAIPFLLIFGWFREFFSVMEISLGYEVKFLGFLTWFWFYFIVTMVFSGILRKYLKVV